MKTIQDLISAIDHRPWEMPATRWTYYQEWNRALFLHWKVPQDLLRTLVPAALGLDLFDGDAWVSLVAFTMEKIRPRGLPAVGFISSFDEINLRTYVTCGNKSGVYFLTIEAGKALSAYTARALSGLPYEPATIVRTSEDLHRYTSANKKRGFRLNASFLFSTKETDKSALDLFLTEKYCLYMRKAGRLYRYEIHHKPWDLYKIERIDLDVSYRLGNLSLPGNPDLVHYSDGVKVIAWDKVPAV